MVDTRIRVAYMITPFGDGGADRQLLQLLQRLDRDRFDPVLYLSHPHGQIVSELPPLQIPVVDVGGLGSNEAAILRLVRLLRRQRPHVIHSWLFTANTWARVAGRLAGVPAVITSERGMELDRNPVYNWIDRALHPLEDRVIVNAQMLADFVVAKRHVPEEKIVVIPNGVDADRFARGMDRRAAREKLGIPLDRPVIGMAASFSPRKRWDVFLDVVKRLNDWRLISALAAGDGAQRTEMMQRAADMGLGDVVHFIGVRADMPDVMSALDIFMLTSDEEGLPNVVLEAMASSRPAVATDAGGTREAVIPGETGFVTPLGAGEELATHAALLLDEPELAERMGAAGRARVERNFTFDVCVGRTCELYVDVLGERHAGVHVLSRV